MATAVAAETPPMADTRATTGCARRWRPAISELIAGLKELRLHGIAAWAKQLKQGGNVGVESSRWLLQHLLQAETTDGVTAARFPVRRDLDFDISPVDCKLVIKRSR